MTRRRWIADEVQGDSAFLTGEHALHLSRVLRAQVGQEFDIAAGDTVRLGTIRSIAGDRVEFSLGATLAANASADLTLALAIFKFDRMEWAIEKCTEIGVARIIPIVARRTDAHLASAAQKRHERWERIARQAAEQSRRASVPEIVFPTKFKDMGASPTVSAATSRIVLAETEKAVHLRDVLQADLDNLVLAVGPEGGWTEEELQWFRQEGWAAASLGDAILRAETAAIVATALALDALR
jgi:16S rRNA (uracil1498-N3)-methyltransferase